MRPPFGRAGTPRTRKPSSVADARPPRARSELATFSIRSVSFSRSSRAPRTRLSPRAPAAARAKRGSSSMRRGTSLGSISVAVSSDDSTSMSPTGSRPRRRRLKTAMRAPMRVSTSRSPVRVGLMPTPWTVSCEPGSSVDATISGAAEEKSPGTSTRSSSSRSALATGSSYLTPCRRRPSMTSGGRPSAVSSFAPMRSSGSATRSTGRPSSDSSPVSSKRPSCPARIPASSRSSVPAFPQSIGLPGSCRPCSPRPWTRTRSTSSSATSAPSERTARRVASVSPERPNPATVVSPSTIAPSRTARCEIDLSPGTETWPTIDTAGSILIAPRTQWSRPRIRPAWPTRPRPLAELLAHELGDRPDLGGESGELTRRDLLRPVGKRLLGARVHLDDDPVGARCGRRPRKRQHELPPAGGMGGVDDHRQVRLLFQDGNGGQVEREARRRLESLDAAFAEDDPLVPFLGHVLGRHQQLLHRCRRSPLEQHRPVDAAAPGEQDEALHAAGADLDHVRDLDDRLDLAGVHQLGHDRQPGLLARLTKHLQRLLAEALEAVRGGAGLKGPAA